MPPAHKRSLQELSSANVQGQEQPSMLHRIRNMWQFANLFQFIQLFGQALKLDDSLDIEDLEAECLKPGAGALQDIGLRLLKFLSSHRGLTHELFDEYTRRQFLSKAPEKNPFGSAELPTKFAHFDVFTKRIEPYGWDRLDRTYFVLDDNRLYRQTDASPPPPKPKSNTKKARAAQRSSKRRRVSSGAASDADDAHDEASDAAEQVGPVDDGLGGMKWECIAVTLDEVRAFLSTIQKSKDPNEKTLRDQIQGHLVPILEKQEESRKRKQLQREKELLNLEKMAYAKRSSRIAGKMEQQKMEERSREEERKKIIEERAAKKEEQQRLKMERERDNRLMSREQRLKEREDRRRLHEEELAQLSEDSKQASNAAARMSERRRLAEIERNKKALRELEEEEDDWIFDCVCGVYGQIDDGTHSVACEKCNTWQHSKCLGIDEQEADQEDFHFVCSSCRRRENTADDPRVKVIKLKVNRHEEPGSSTGEHLVEESTGPSQQPPAQLVVELQSRPLAKSSSGPEPLPLPSPAPALQATQLPVSDLPEQRVNSNPATDTASGPDQTQRSPVSQGNNPFSSPHPSLLPPGRQPVKFDAPNLPLGNAATLPANDDDTKTGSVAKMVVLDSVLSSLAGSGNGGSSPSKQPHRPPSPPTKTSAPTPAASNVLASSFSTENTSSMTSASSISLPHLTPAQTRDARSDPVVSGSSPLPPFSGGLSPTKHSPPAPKRQQPVNGGAGAAASHPPSAVFPPVAALSPSPRQQVLTPPVKPAEPVRVPLLQPPQGTQTTKLVPSNSPRPDAHSS
ncbi:hypothetical protein CHGG_02746 [Chaetomium globosum CBS 148.51]|uniref:Zinc finger PHD-type domain-containing protein n=1 Tax=Chaetomium globosum (strain ATCC 6205 / CBS 148.51 / DSM 1962 / NBRC 6347 / NRRL 1970) TaxID=306901 RepID=Q2HAK8_CHAGB|nr:uncharacterized protein CHGG_02746 [Chaetomium globosum CBS 148.51]EAQ90811.1 hypothetical protein CHGG_02746 [Chaetomium globosum CBS 148.51]